MKRWGTETRHRKSPHKVAKAKARERKIKRLIATGEYDSYRAHKDGLVKNVRRLRFEDLFNVDLLGPPPERGRWWDRRARK